MCFEAVASRAGQADAHATMVCSPARRADQVKLLLHENGHVETCDHAAIDAQNGDGHCLPCFDLFQQFAHVVEACRLMATDLDDDVATLESQAVCGTVGFDGGDGQADGGAKPEAACHAFVDCLGGQAEFLFE